jgi:biotin carboxyl carrier protein
MPGTILDIKVKPGDAVKAGDVLLILEAMKMENEIIAPSAGTIDTIQVSKGSSVNAGDVLLSIK